MKDARNVRSTGQSEAGHFKDLIERLETHIQKGDALIADLWRELVDEELNLTHTFGAAGRSTEEQRLQIAERLIVAMEEDLGVSQGDETPTERNEEEKPPDVSTAREESDGHDEDPLLEDLQIDDLEQEIRELEVEFQELEFGFRTGQFQSLVYEELTKLKRDGGLRPSSVPPLGKEEEKIIDEIEVQLAAAETWAADLEARVAKRDREESVWTVQYKQALDKIESVR